MYKYYMFIKSDKGDTFFIVSDLLLFLIEYLKELLI